MRFLTLVLSASAAAAAPFSFPLPNGFPNLNATARVEVYKLAGGTFPNSALPTSLKAGGTQTLQLIAANEIFEVAYFTELLYNVTNNVPGYDVMDKDYVVKTLTAVVNVSLPFVPTLSHKEQILTPQTARTSPHPSRKRRPSQRKADHHPTLPILIPSRQFRRCHHLGPNFHRRCPGRSSSRAKRFPRRWRR